MFRSTGESAAEHCSIGLMMHCANYRPIQHLRALAASTPHCSAPLGIAGQLYYSIGQRSRISGRDEQACFVAHSLLYAADIGGDHGKTACHRLEDCVVRGRID